MDPIAINRKSLAEEVASKLQEQILKGAYKVNQKLPIEAELMKSFNVGRSTIREAVKILVNSGFLRVQQGLGTFVDDVTGINEPFFQKLKRSGSNNIDEVRQLLEMKIAERAASNRSGNDISKLEYFLAKREKAINNNLIDDFIEAHINFYIVMAEASKNEILSDLYKLFAVKLKTDLKAVNEDTTLFKSNIDYLPKIFDSILRQDPKQAWFWSAKVTGNFAN